MRTRRVEQRGYAQAYFMCEQVGFGKFDDTDEFNKQMQAGSEHMNPPYHQLLIWYDMMRR